jgi:ParB family chromosome partitioning protein
MVKISIKEIHIGQNMRGLNQETVDFLTGSIREIGLLHAITVEEVDGSPKYLLRAGNHRLHACINLGWDMIEANIRKVVDDDRREELRMKLVTIDENLARTGSYLEQDELIAERKEIFEELYPWLKNGGDPKTKEKTRTDLIGTGQVVPEKGFTSQVSSVLGVSKDSVENAIKRASNIIPEVKAEIRSLGEKVINKTTANHIAVMSPDEQRAFIAEVKSNPENAKVFTKTANENYAVTRAEEIKTDPVRQEKVEKTITESLGVRSVAEIGEEGTKS